MLQYRIQPEPTDEKGPLTTDSSSHTIPRLAGDLKPLGEAVLTATAGRRKAMATGGRIIHAPRGWCACLASVGSLSILQKRALTLSRSY